LLLLLIAGVLAGCTPKSDVPAAESTGASWETGDNREVWSRCGPAAGEAEDCLSLARRYADGTQSNLPVCISEIGGPNDEALNNAWLTLGPNGADPAAFEQLRARRLARFQSALAVANDPGADLAAAQRALFRAEFTDCWNTYGALRGLNASPKARDDFLAMMDRFHSSP
jgi:hypothetical protein